MSPTAITRFYPYFAKDTVFAFYLYNTPLDLTLQKRVNG